MACNCKNKLNNYIDVSKINEQDWEDTNSVVALDECGNIVIAEKPDTLVKDDRKKVNSIRLKGKGEKALYDDGEYKKTYTAEETERKLKNYHTKQEIDQKLEQFEDYYTKQEIDQNLSSTLEDYYTKKETDNNLSSALQDYYTQKQIDSTLKDAVFYDHNNNINTKNNILLGEQHKIIAKQTAEEEKLTFNVIDNSRWNNIDFGSEQVKFNIKSKDRPTVLLQGEEQEQNIAFQSDIQQTENALQNQIHHIHHQTQSNTKHLNQLQEETQNALTDLDKKVNSNAQNISLNTLEIKTLRDDFNAAEHFKGYFKTYLEIQNIPAEQGAFAWCAQTGTVWTYNIELKTWQDSGNIIPDQTVMAYDGTPLMDGEAQSGTSNQYARGDHRHPSDKNKADKEELDQLTDNFSEHIREYNSFKEETDLTLDAVNDNITQIQQDVKENTQNIAINTTDIQTLRNDFNAAEHFKGCFKSYLEIQDIPGEEGTFAWCAETGTVWIYNIELKTWQDSQKEVPDQTVFAYDASPLMDGKAEAGTSNLYARGDHRHPSDKNKADKTDLENYLSLQGNSENTQMTGDIWLGTKNKVYVTDSGNSFIGQDENTQTTILRGFGGSGIDLQTDISDVKYNGVKIATVDDLLPAEDRTKVDALKIDGDGDKFLADDGKYKKIDALDDFYLPLTGGTLTGSLGITNPEAENTFNIEVSEKGYVYLDSESPIHITYKNEEEQISSTITLEDGAINTRGNILPVTDSRYNLGGNTQQFNKAYIKELYLNYQNKTEQINALNTQGEGTKFLADDGEYKPIELDYLPLEGGTLTGDMYTQNVLPNTSDATIGEKENKYDYGYFNSLNVKRIYNDSETSLTIIDTKEIGLRAPTILVNQREVATKDDIITSREGDGTKFLSDDGTYKEVVTDVPGFTEDNPARDLYLADSGSIYFGHPEQELFATIHNDDGVTITQRNFISLDAPNVYINGKEVATKEDIPQTDNLVINGKNEKNLEISAPSISLNANISGITLNEQNITVESKGEIYFSTGEKLFYNHNEIATKEDIITSTQGDGTKFLANDGQYKELKTLTGSDVISMANDKIDITVDESDKVITKDKAGLKVNIDIAINGNTITLYGKDNKVINTIELTQSQIIQCAYIDTNTNELVIVFITEEGTQEVRADLSQLITPYLAGSYITLTGDDNNVINVNYTALKSQLLNDGFGTNYVTTNTEQTISGVKTFTQRPISNVGYLSKNKYGYSTENSEGDVTSALVLNSNNQFILGGVDTRNYPVNMYNTPSAALTATNSTLLPNCGWVNTRIANSLASIDLSNYVTINSDQTITAVKTFSATPIINQNISFQYISNVDNARGIIWYKPTTNEKIANLGLLYQNGEAQYIYIGVNSGDYNNKGNIFIQNDGVLVTNNILPKTSSTFTLGNPNRYWDSGYINNIISSAGTIRPVSSGTGSLGTPALRWGNIYGQYAAFSGAQGVPAIRSYGLETSFHITPTTTRAFNFGSTALEFANLYIANIHSSVDINGVAGTFTGNLSTNTLTVTGNTTLQGTLGVSGNTAISGTLTVGNTIAPNADGTINLGVSAGRWAGVYTNLLDVTTEITLTATPTPNADNTTVPNIGWVKDRLNTELTGANILSKLNSLNEISFSKHVVCSAGAGTVATSDIRFKKNIQPLESSLQAIENLDLFHYDWEKEDGTLIPNQIGLSAQQLEQSYPELVHQMQDERQTRTVDYSRLVVPALKAIQELSAKINTLETELSELKKQLNS